MQTLETLHYYVLCMLYPFLGYLDDQCAEFLELWLDYYGFRNFQTLLSTTLLLEKIHYLRKSTLLLKIVHYLQTI